MRQKRAKLSIFAAAIVLITLVGCAGVAHPQASAHRSTTPIATSTPTAAALPAPPASETPKPCADLVPTASIQSLIGDVPPDADAGIDRPLGYLAEQTQEGFSSCGWGDALTKDAPAGFELTFRRHAAAVIPTLPQGSIAYPGGAPLGIGADASSAVCGTGNGSDVCNVRFQVGDYVVGVWTQRPDSAGGLAAFTVGVQALLRPLVTSLQTMPVPATWQRPTPAWPATTDCTQIARSGGVAAAAGWTSAETGDEANDNAPEDISLGGGLECLWLRPGPATSADPATQPELAVADYVQGGAWIWRSFAAQKGFQQEDVVGSDRAGMICDGSVGGCQVAAIVGDDLVSVVPSSDMTIGNGTDLGRNLLPVLAAALRGIA